MSARPTGDELVDGLTEATARSLNQAHECDGCDLCDDAASNFTAELLRAIREGNPS